MKLLITVLIIVGLVFLYKITPPLVIVFGCFSIFALGLLWFHVNLKKDLIRSLRSRFPDVEIEDESLFLSDSNSEMILLVFTHETLEELEIAITDFFGRKKYIKSPSPFQISNMKETSASFFLTKKDVKLAVLITPEKHQSKNGFHVRIDPRN